MLEAHGVPFQIVGMSKGLIFLHVPHCLKPSGVLTTVDSNHVSADDVCMASPKHPMGIPPFDPKANCVKCGYSIPDPVAPTKVGPEGGLQPTGPAPEPQPPTTMFCNGDEQECTWNDTSEPYMEHMHQWCDVCGSEWLSYPLDWDGTDGGWSNSGYTG